MTIRFDNAADKLTLASAGVSTSILSACVWVRLTSDLNTYTEMMSLGTTGSGDYVSFGNSSSGTNIQCSDWNNDFVGSNLSLLEWYFVGFTKNVNAWKLYLAPLRTMKLAIDITATAGQTFSTNTLEIGNNTGTGNRFNGRMFNFKLWSGAE